MEQKEITNEARLFEIEKIRDAVDSIPGDMNKKFPFLGLMVEYLADICKEQENRIIELENAINMLKR